MLRVYPPLWTPKVVQKMFPRLTPYVIRKISPVVGVEPTMINRKELYTPEDVRRIYYAWWTGKTKGPFPWDEDDYTPIGSYPVFSSKEVAEELGIGITSVLQRSTRYNVGRKPFHSSRVFTPGDVNKLKRAIKTRGRDTPFRYDMFHKNIKSQALDEAIKTIHNKFSKGCFDDAPRKERKMASKRPVTISTTISNEMDKWLDKKVEELAPVARKGGIVYKILEEAMRKDIPIQEEESDESDR